MNYTIVATLPNYTPWPIKQQGITLKVPASARFFIFLSFAFCFFAVNY